MLRTYLAGWRHRTMAEQEAKRALEANDPLILEADPNNEFDPNAIKVLTAEGVFIGFIPASHCAKLLALGLDSLSAYWSGNGDSLYVVDGEEDSGDREDGESGEAA